MKKSIAICDDEEKVCMDLAEQLGQIVTQEHEIITAQSVTELEKVLQKKKRENRPVDILFLDIELQGENGIEAAVSWQKEFPQMAIIFITGYVDYAKDIFKVIPTYFLVKPFTRIQIEEALNRAEQMRIGQMPLPMPITVDKKIISVAQQSIRYVESKNRTIEIVTAEERYKTYMKLDELQSKLSDQFVRPHKSFLVNMNGIKYISAKEMILYDGTTIPISRRRYQQTKEAYLSYFS